MASVTIPGSGSSTITETFGSQANQQLAIQIGNALASASAGGVLTVTTVPGGGNVPLPPAALGAGGVNELVINAAGSYTIPAATAGAPDYVVVIDPTTTGGVTIHGASDSSIWGGNANVTIVDPAVIALGEEAGNAVVTINGSNDVLAGNNLNDTLTAAGVAGSIAGGTGTNLFVDLGANDTISAQGTSDTIFGGPGSATIQLLGASIFNNGTPDPDHNGTTLTALPGARNALVVGGKGALTVTDAGTGDAITGGKGALDVTTSGSAASVVGGFGSLFVTDNGVSDTITAGFGFTSVTAATSAAVVVGGAGLLNFVGGAGASTIMGSSGNVAVTGGGGGMSLFGGAGGSISYRNITDGSVSYTAGIGNETIDASLSGGHGLYVGGLDTAGHNLLIAGAGADTLVAGSGADTLSGGGGANIFNFVAAQGGPAANDIISDFSAIDKVRLVGYVGGTALNAVNNAIVAGGSTTITLSDNTRITFTGLTDPGALFGGHVLAVPPIG
jgi:Ca2+-binding RTX toxin-like protein